MAKELLHTGSLNAQALEAAAGRIAAQCGLKPLTARVLAARGIIEPEEAERFLTPSLERDWHSPALIPGLEAVADKVESVIRAGGRILIFGDFDVDGITATAISVLGLRALGADAVGLIPHRYDEGYALSEAAVERGMLMGPDLVVTVDCGISCASEVESMLVRGIDVCITDHHEPGDSVPQGVAVADPKLDESCPSRDLAGAGVALKLICVLGERFGKPELWRAYTDLAALGTIADLMPLRGENRALVADGVARMRNGTRTSLLALATMCGVKSQDITSTKLSFSLIPRINAAGRMGDATVALDLLLSDDYEQAQTLAHDLDAINTQRREAESRLAEQVEGVVVREFHGEPVIVVMGEGWHEGVKGIVASRIAREYKRPTIVFSEEEGIARGSGRTYGGINLFDLASTCSDLFEKFGGHAAAIGITLKAERIGELRERLCAGAESFRAEELADSQLVDCTVDVQECTVEGFQELERLQPFGNDNKVPRLLLERVFLERQGAVGKTGSHLRYQATDGVAQVAGIFFGVENMEELLNCSSPCDIVFEPTVDEWQGRYTAKLMTKDIHLLGVEPAPQTDVSERVGELFERADEICDTGDYAGITQMARFNTKVVGVTFENRQSVLATLEAGVELMLRRQPGNEMDSNAIAVHLTDGVQIGFLNRHLARRLAPVMDAGVAYDAAVTAVTGGPQAGAGVREPGPLGVRDPGVVSRSYGVNIVVRRPDLDSAERAVAGREGEDGPDQLRERWQNLPHAELEDELRRALIGDHGLHRAQREALDCLSRGLSTLAVMATGRGKSLIFHLHAARCALLQGKASVFVYPLRALVADQAYHLQEKFAQFGLNVQVLTGESDAATRAECFSGLADGTVDVVLTTPEFLQINAELFAQGGRVGFVVVDEAHHIGQARAGNRPAYAQMAQTLEALGAPVVLAVTATAGTETADAICRTLSIERTVLDPTVRENLRIDDKRDLRNRENYVASLAASGAKCVVYVNSREQSMTLTRMLRHRLPALAPKIAFYNAGLAKADRKLIEDAFRDGDLCTIVSTSAFGEGIDIPDIEHVVLYHLPFSDVEFNQMSGRAGRDGREATVHLAYSYGDARINEKILSSSAPERAQMVALYKALKALQVQAAKEGAESFSATNAELAERALSIDRRAKIDEAGVSCGIAVFRELGFLETTGRSVARRIRMVNGPARMELTDSARYREGMEEIEKFAQFKQWALGAQADELLERFNRPILPDAGSLPPQVGSEQ